MSEPENQLSTMFSSSMNLTSGPEIDTRFQNFPPPPPITASSETSAFSSFPVFSTTSFPTPSVPREESESESSDESESDEEDIPKPKRQRKAKDPWPAWIKFTPGPVRKDIQLKCKDPVNPMASDPIYQYGHHIELIKILQYKRFAFTASKTGSGKTYVIGRIFMKMQDIVQQGGFKHMLVIGPVSAEGAWDAICTEFGITNVSFISYAGLAARTNVKLKHPFLVREDFKDDAGNKKVSFKITETFATMVSEGLMLVIDECHRVKNKDSGNSKAVKVMTSYISRTGARSRFVFLSATPFDKPEHAKTIFGLIGVSSKKLYGKAFTGDWEWKKLGLGQIVDYCRELNSEMTNIIVSNNEFMLDNEPTAKAVTQMCYDLYTEVFVPAVVRSMVKPPLPIELEPEYRNLFMNMTPEEHVIYMKAVNEYSNYVNEKRSGIIGGDVHKAVELSKLPSTIRTIQHFHRLYPNAKIIVYQNHKESIVRLQQEFAQYNPLIYSGDAKLTKKKDRKSIVAKFNEPNLNHWLFFASTKAGGESISLHDRDGRFPRIMLLSPSFFFIESVQAAGRTDRIDLASKTFIYFLYGGSEGLELKYINTTVAKSKNTKGTLQKEAQEKTVYPGDYIIVDQQEDMSLLERKNKESS